MGAFTRVSSQRSFTTSYYNLDLAGPALDEEVVARLLLATVIPPAFVKPYCLCNL